MRRCRKFINLMRIKKSIQKKAEKNRRNKTKKCLIINNELKVINSVKICLIN